MSLGLEALAPCFQGIIPALFFTCAKDGTPNVAYLSHVDYVDAAHVALSFQFFNKSRKNVAENPHALVHVTDPDTQQGWSLRLKFVRSETEGAVFERMALRIEAIASYSGLKGIFKLLAADIYEVTDVAPIAQEPGHLECGATDRDRRAGADAVFTMKALQDVSQRINQASCLDDLLDSILASIEESFGFSHSMILLAGEEPGVLVTIATRGYGGTGVGAEARFGLGISGLVAEARKPIRISGLLRGMLYAYAVKQRAEQAGLCPAHTTIEMPGLQNPSSQLGVPLLVRGELVGVLCIESERPYRFHEEDKTSIELLGSYLAIAIQHMQESSESVTDSTSVGAGLVPAEPTTMPQQAVYEVTYYHTDETILVDGDYLIRGLPAKILWKVLTLHAAEGRREFTNRELRLDKSLNLPGYKDNLETRLLLLRRRLDQKLPGLRLVPSGRGRFALQLAADVRLVEKE
jgi:GAF domain-containing protein